jgi:hypothetical protein
MPITRSKSQSQTPQPLPRHDQQKSAERSEACAALPVSRSKDNAPRLFTGRKVSKLKRMATGRKQPPPGAISFSRDQSVKSAATDGELAGTKSISLEPARLPEARTAPFKITRQRPAPTTLRNVTE